MQMLEEFIQEYDDERSTLKRVWELNINQMKRGT